MSIDTISYNSTSELFDTVKDIAKPGDILFFIKNHPPDYFPWYRQMARKIIGVDDSNISWHTGIYIGEAQSDSLDEKINLAQIDANRETNVAKRELQTDFLSEYPGSRLEIRRYKGITTKEREVITSYAESKVGKRFDTIAVIGSVLTHLFGLPNVLDALTALLYEGYSCNELVTSAYAEVGKYFCHPNGTHPIGHPHNHQNQRFSYLMGHNLHSDKNLSFVLSVSKIDEAFELRTN